MRFRTQYRTEPPPHRPPAFHSPDVDPTEETQQHATAQRTDLHGPTTPPWSGTRRTPVRCGPPRPWACSLCRHRRPSRTNRDGRPRRSRRLQAPGPERFATPPRTPQELWDAADYLVRSGQPDWPCPTSRAFSPPSPTTPPCSSSATSMAWARSCGFRMTLRPQAWPSPCSTGWHWPRVARPRSARTPAESIAQLTGTQR